MKSQALVGAFKRITGKGDSVSQKMASTFKALAGLADWTAGSVAVQVALDTDTEAESAEVPAAAPTVAPTQGVAGFPTLHHDVHIHLPVSTDVKVYDAIFRSLREHLG